MSKCTCYLNIKSCHNSLITHKKVYLSFNISYSFGIDNNLICLASYSLSCSW